MRHLLMAAVTLGMLAIGAHRASAATVLITNAAQMGQVDTINWGPLGAPGTIVNAPFNILTQNGLTVQVLTNLNFKRVDQGNGFMGDFLPGTQLLATNTQDSTHLHFSTPVWGAGLYIQHATLDSFNPYVLVMSGSTTIAQFMLPASINRHSGDGNVPFVGVLSDSAVITDIYFDSFFGGNTVTSGVQVKTTPTPLPPAAFAGALLIPAAFFASRRKKAAA